VGDRLSHAQDLTAHLGKGSMSRTLPYDPMATTSRAVDDDKARDKESDR